MRASRRRKGVPNMPAKKKAKKPATKRKVAKKPVAKKRKPAKKRK